jgi:hypothetical protein
MKIIVRPGSAGRRFRGKENYRGLKSTVNTKSGKVGKERRPPYLPAPPGSAGAEAADGLDGAVAVRLVTHWPMK